MHYSTSFLPSFLPIYFSRRPGFILSRCCSVLLPGQPENIRRGRKNRTSSSKPAHFLYQLPMHPRHSVRNGVGRSLGYRQRPSRDGVCRFIIMNEQILNSTTFRTLLKNSLPNSFRTGAVGGVSQINIRDELSERKITPLTTHRSRQTVYNN